MKTVTRIEKKPKNEAVEKGLASMYNEFKIAHKRADSEKWSAGDRAQRNRLIKFLQELIEELESQEVEEKNMPVAA